MRSRELDLADLLLVASASTGSPVDDLLVAADITLLALIAQRVRDRAAPQDAAAEILVGVAAGRPFPRNNSAAAWALAAFVATSRRHRLTMSPPDAMRLVASARDGRLDEAALARQLAVGLTRRRRAVDAFARLLEMPPAPRPLVWACPACGRGISVPPRRSSIFLIDPLPHDVVTDCAVRNSSHDRGVSTRSSPALVLFRDVTERPRSTAELAGVG